MRKFQKNKGITLIALIITIIVLLILAGVSISLVVGDNGVLVQSKNASDVTQEKTAVEEVELAYSSLMSKYYEEYASNASVDKWAYVDETKLNSELIGMGQIVPNSFNKDDETKKIMFTYNSYGKNTTYRIKITEDGRVARAGGVFTINLYNSEEATTSTELTIEEGESVFNNTNYLEIKSAVDSLAPSGKKFDKWVLKDTTTDATNLLNSVSQSIDVCATFKDIVLPFRTYGEPVATDTIAGTYGVLGTQVLLNGGDSIAVPVGSEITIQDNWKVFYEDDDFVYLIYGDYYPVDVQTNSDCSTIGFGENAPYEVKDTSSRENLLKYLRNNSAYEWNSNSPYGDNHGTNGTTYASWSNLKEALSGTTELNGKEISIQGSPDMDLWVKSWNTKGNIELQTSKIYWGYQIGLASGSTDRNVDLSSYAGYNDALYFPYKGRTSPYGLHATDAEAYWLASPNGWAYYKGCFVHYNGYVEHGDYYGSYHCARPVISIAK